MKHKKVPINRLMDLYDYDSFKRSDAENIALARKHPDLATLDDKAIANYYYQHKERHDWDNLTPDTIHGTNSIAFYYGINGKIFYSKPGQTHREMTDTTEVRVGPKHLSGRFLNSKYNGKRVSFWEKDKTFYDELLTPCLEKLKADGLIDDDTIISTPVTNQFRLNNYNLIKTKYLTPEEDANVDLAKKMHLMTGAAKQAAMKQLGVGGNFGSKKADPWKQAMLRHGLLSPGQSWRNPQSETVMSFKEWLYSESH